MVGWMGCVATDGNEVPAMEGFVRGDFEVDCIFGNVVAW